MNQPARANRKKMKQGQGETSGRWASSYRVVREGLPEEVLFEQKEKKELALRRAGKRAPGRRHSMCKGPEVGISKVSVV